MAHFTVKRGKKAHKPLSHYKCLKVLPWDKSVVDVKRSIALAFCGRDLGSHLFCYFSGDDCLVTLFVSFSVCSPTSA